MRIWWVLSSTKVGFPAKAFKNEFARNVLAEDDMKIIK